jgi:hypothetical protein
MTQAAPASQDDLAYVRQLAESGARAPLIGGRFMAWWGFILTIAYVAHYLALKGMIGDGGGAIFGIIWIGFSVAGVAGQFLLVRSMPPKAGAGSAGNRASRTAWTAAACAIGSMVIGCIVAAQTGAGPATFDWIVPVAFSVYACALIVTGSLSGDRITVMAGGGAVVMVGLFTALILHPDRYLLAAAGVAATVLLPGLLLLRAEPGSQD